MCGGIVFRGNFKKFLTHSETLPGLLSQNHHQKIVIDCINNSKLLYKMFLFFFENRVVHILYEVNTLGFRYN